MEDKGVSGDMSLPLVKTQCRRCHHIGKSRYPKTYMCGACYYINRARANRTMVDKLRERAGHLLDMASVYEHRSSEFSKRHPGAGELIKRREE